MLLLLGAAEAPAKPPPALKGPVATLGDRTVEAIDIERAGKALAGDPEGNKTPGAWRRFLLDRVVDRELLSAEALRRGWLDSASVKERAADRHHATLSRLMFEKVLVPGIAPTPDEFAAIKADGDYRYVDALYILLRDDPSRQRRALAERIAARARAGGAWDSLAKMYSGHPPSAAAGGKLGLVLVREWDAATRAALKEAAPGDVVGPFSGPYGHEVIKVLGWQEMTDDSLRSLLIDERTRKITENHETKLLAKYHFAIDSTEAYAAIRALGAEDPDSILASLGPDGTRPARGIQNALGILARADGATVTLGDIIRRVRPARNEVGRIRVRDMHQLEPLASKAILRHLWIRDALERGMGDDPLVARELRLQREEAAVRSMVEAARPSDPDAAALRAYVEGLSTRYRHPAGRRVTVLMYATADSARESLKSWNGVGLPAESTLVRAGFRVNPRPTASNLFPGWMGSLTLPENGRDPLSTSVRGLDAGQFAPVIAVPQGWAVAFVTGLEAARPMTEAEAAPRALRDWREEAENRWVTDLLVRLRTKTPVNVIPARLEAVRLAGPAGAAKPRAAKSASAGGGAK